MYKKLQAIVLICTVLCTLSYIPIAKASLTTVFRPSNLTSGLQGNWKLDEASGNRADSSGNGNTLTDNNTVGSIAENYWDTENSADFEAGNSESLSITNGSQTGLNIGGAGSSITFAAWVKTESLSGAVGYLCTKGGALGDGYAFGVTSGQWQMYVNTTQFVSGITTDLIDGRWTHVAATYSDTDNTVALYINGNIIKTFNTSATLNTSSSTFYLGDRGDQTQFFDGLVKDAGIWNVALTASQIKSLAHGIDISTDVLRPNSTEITTPTVYWKLNEISDTTNAKTRVATVGSNNLTDNNTVNTLGGYAEGAGADLESGNSEYFNTANSTNFNFGTGDFTVGGWVKFESTTGAQTFYSYNGDDDISLKKEAAGTFACYLGGVDQASMTWSPVANTWYHVSCKRSGTTVTAYIDGFPDPSPGTSSHDVTDTGDLNIGRQTGGTQHFDGVMSDWAIWKGTALAESDIDKIAKGLPIQQTGIVSYWKMDETSGTRNDSKDSNHLTDNNTVASATGQVGNAADFEDTNSEWLSIADGSQTGLDITGDLYTQVWFKPESTGTAHTLQTKGVYTSTGYMVQINGANTNTWYIADQNTNGTRSISSTSTWYCLQYNMIDEANLAEVYGDGILETSAANTGSLTDTASPFEIGRRNSTATQFADGLVDEVVIASRYFRADEIKAGYLKGYNGSEFTSASVTVVASTRPRLTVISGD